MKAWKIVKGILLGALYTTNLFWALVLYWCGLGEHIMIGIFAICFYRLSLWFTPVLVTVICWIPLPPRVAVWKKLIFYFANITFCAALYLTCFLLFGNWF